MEVNDLFNVNGLVAVITGGGSGKYPNPFMSTLEAKYCVGIGLIMAKALEANGAATVYIIGRRLQLLETACKESKYGNIIPLQGDVTSNADLSRLVAEIKSRSGFINLLIANAGISGPDLSALPSSRQPTLSAFRETLWEPSFDTFAKTFAVNSTATFYTVVAFLELLHLGNQKGNVPQSSQVVATSSVSGFNRNVPGGFAYAGSKAATTHMMKQFATMLAPYAIRSNIIAPGIYPSEMTSAATAKRSEQLKEEQPELIPVSVIPAQRMGDEQDMAGVVLFLASRAGAYCNGNVLVTDGGRLSVMPSTY